MKKRSEAKIFRHSDSLNRLGAREFSSRASIVSCLILAIADLHSVLFLSQTRTHFLSFSKRISSNVLLLFFGCFHSDSHQIVCRYIGSEYAQQWIWIARILFSLYLIHCSVWLNVTSNRRTEETKENKRKNNRDLSLSFHFGSLVKYRRQFHIYFELTI